MSIDIKIDYLFKGEPYSEQTCSEAINALHLDPVDKTTYEREVIEHLIKRHFSDDESVPVRVGDLKKAVHCDKKNNPHSIAQYAHLFNLEQIMVHVQGYCFPLAA
jgi:hypothetical protein